MYLAGLKQINPTALITLKAQRANLTAQQYQTLRGQVLAGDAEGALKGLTKILSRKRNEVKGE